MFYCVLCGEPLDINRELIDVALQGLKCKNGHLYYFYKMDVRDNCSQVLYEDNYNIEKLRNFLSDENIRPNMKAAFASIVRTAINILDKKEEIFNESSLMNSINFCVGCGEPVKEEHLKNEIYHSYFKCVNKHNIYYRDSFSIYSNGARKELFYEHTKKLYLQIVLNLMNTGENYSLSGRIRALLRMHVPRDARFDGEMLIVKELFPFLLDMINSELGDQKQQGSARILSI